MHCLCTCASCITLSLSYPHENAGMPMLLCMQNKHQLVAVSWGNWLFALPKCSMLGFNLKLTCVASSHTLRCQGPARYACAMSVFEPCVSFCRLSASSPLHVCCTTSQVIFGETAHSDASSKTRQSASAEEPIALPQLPTSFVAEVFISCS